MKQLIQFRKQRELGEILSDVFAFLRNEYKPFFSLILQIILPYLILSFVSLAFLLYTFGDFSSLITSESSPFEADGLNLLMLSASGLVLAICGILVYVYSYSATLHYIKSYIENNGIVKPDIVKNTVKQTLWSFIGLSILRGFALFIGLMLCIIPGLYLIVPMSVVFCIMIFEQKSVIDAFSDSFTFIKNEWLMSFLVLFVAFIIITVIGGVLNLPTTIYTYIKMGIFSGEFDAASNPLGFYKDPIYIVLNLIGYAFKFFLNFVIIIVTVFIYFNINEKKNFTGTFEQIEALGNTAP